MFRRVLTRSAAGASAAIALAAVAGLFAPADPRFEMINHFRPILLAAAAGTFVLSLLLRRRALIIVSAVPLALLVALALAPLYFLAHSANGEKPSLRIASLNLWVNNEQLAQTAEFLRASQSSCLTTMQDRSSTLRIAGSRITATRARLAKEATPPQLERREVRKHGYGGVTAPIVHMSDWREALVAVASHEARHIWQYQHDQPRSEVDAERYSAARLALWREWRTWREGPVAM